MQCITQAVRPSLVRYIHAAAMTTTTTSRASRRSQQRADDSASGGPWCVSLLKDCLPRLSHTADTDSDHPTGTTCLETGMDREEQEEESGPRRRLSNPLHLLHFRRRSSSKPRVPLISTTSLFNRLQTSGVVLIDCRKPELFAARSLPGALLCPPPPPPIYRRKQTRTVDAALARVHNPLLARKLAARDLMEVVVIGGNRSPNSLLYRLDWGYRFARLLLEEGRVFSVKFLAQGFPAFVDKYPFMAVSGGGLGDSMNSTRSAASSSAASSDDGSEDCRRLDRSVSCASSIGSVSSSSRSRSVDAVDPAPPVLTRHDDDAAFYAPPKQSDAAVGPYPNEILDGFLFLGNFWQANSLAVVRALRITHVVNMGALTPHRQRFPGVQYLDVPIRDCESEDIRRAFEPVLAFIDCAHAAGDARVLVHCVQGVSRSSTVAILYVMRHKKCTLSAAYSHVLKCRPLIFPNRGFMAQLLAVERALYGGAASVSEEEVDALQSGLLPPVDRRGSALHQTFL